MSYGVGPRSYLARAREALQSGTQAGLFHAAFELRCCIEARQAEYVEALAEYEDTKIRPWNLAQTGKRIKNKSYNSTITMMRFEFSDGTTFTTYHTPVTDQLIAFAKRTLHPLLHCQTLFRADDDPWWATARDELTHGYRMAWLACQGDSLVPPLWNPVTKQPHPTRIELRDHNAHLADVFNRMIGEPGTLQIAYPDTHPVEWICDL